MTDDIKTVPMVRGDKTADVHPNEVEHMKTHDWVIAEAVKPGGGDSGSGDGQVSETPDGVPTPIPADWRDMHHTKIIVLAKELHGDFDATADKTMTERARSIIEAAEADRANPPAKSE